MQKNRETFIDSIKIYVCILVVLGHFFQSMTLSQIIWDNALLQWFDTTIYYFHVPLFFVCSGYLYHKYTKTDTLHAWKNNTLKKASVLLIPYFIFSLITWLMKVMFSSSVNTQADGLLETLFLQPLSPYWYLYTLFIIFLLTPALNSKKATLVTLTIALILKVLTFFVPDCSVFAISSVLQNEIWFVMGMCLSAFSLTDKLSSRRSLVTAGILSVVFVAVSVVLSQKHIAHKSVSFVMGFVAVVATVAMFIKIQHLSMVQKFTRKLAKYTMPVFLMHTIFAAAARALLLKLGIANATLHIVLGIVISFAGPIVAAVVMSKVKWLDFPLYPNKYIFNSRGKDNG